MCKRSSDSHFKGKSPWGKLKVLPIDNPVQTSASSWAHCNLSLLQFSCKWWTIQKRDKGWKVSFSPISALTAYNSTAICQLAIFDEWCSAFVRQSVIEFIQKWIIREPCLTLLLVGRLRQLHLRCSYVCYKYYRKRTLLILLALLISYSPYWTTALHFLRHWNADPYFPADNYESEADSHK